jgi:hypothetical protein
VVLNRHYGLYLRIFLVKDGRLDSVGLHPLKDLRLGRNRTHPKGKGKENEGLGKKDYQ